MKILKLIHLIAFTALLTITTGVIASTIGIASDNYTIHYTILTFDIEEDWNPQTHCYYNSYQYITSGAFSQFVDGLNERGISAVFFITPNLALDMPEVVKCLQNNNQSIGVHLHPHNFIEIEYPYCPPYTETKGEELNQYSYQGKLDFMTRAKEIVESAVGNKTIFYRSGKYSVDNELDTIARNISYQVVTNRLGTFYIEELGIWNLSKATWDILDSDVFTSLDKYMHFYTTCTRESCFESEKGDIIVLSGHPMRLYNLDTGEVNKGAICLFFDFIDKLQQDPHVKIINSSQLLDILNGGN